VKKPSTILKAFWFAVGLVWFPVWAVLEFVVVGLVIVSILEAFFAPPKAPPPPVHGDPGEAPVEVAPFIPADWRVEQHAATNLDSDGSGDLVLLLGPSQEGFGPTDNTPLVDRCRNLLLLYGKEGGYERAQYLPWRLRVVVDPDNSDARKSPCPLSEDGWGAGDSFDAADGGGFSISYQEGELGFSATFRAGRKCLELIEIYRSYWSHGNCCEGLGNSSETDFRTGVDTYVEHERYDGEPHETRTFGHFIRPRPICAQTLTGIWLEDHEGRLHPDLAAVYPPNIPFADVDAPFQAEAPTARAGCATPPAAMFARTPQDTVPLRIRSPQTPADSITSASAANTFSLGQTVLEASERCTYQAATLWAEDDCGLWFRFDRATDCPYDVTREGPLDSGDWWHDDQPLEWSGALGSYFVLPRERDGSYLLSSLPSISNACDGPCKNEILPIRFNRLGRGRFAATAVRAEDVPPPAREGRW